MDTGHISEKVFSPLEQSKKSFDMSQTSLLKSELNNNAEVISHHPSPKPADHSSVGTYQQSTVGRNLLSELLLEAQIGQGHIVRLLCEKGADINAQDKGGMTPLCRASFYGYTAIVRILLNRLAAVDIQEEGGHTALSIAASRGHEAIVRMLIEGGADIKSQNKFGETPLSTAAAHGRMAIVTILLKNGADVNIREHDGNNSLSIAASRGYEDIM